jgi:general secretion pathway protein M
MTTALTQHLTPARTALRSWWRGLAQRERRALQTAAVLVGVALLWLVAIGPAARTLQTAPAERERLDGQLQQMQALAAEAKGLRGATPVTPDAARSAVEAAAARLGARAKLTLQAQRAVLAVKGVGSDELGAFMAEARAGARARVVEATLTQASPGLYDGSLTLSLGGATR